MRVTVSEVLGAVRVRLRWTSYEIELPSYDVVGDMAYTEGFERPSASVEGRPRTYTLRATQVYRWENGQWRVTHRHADTVAG
jgi:ketosteroid isomerase-like protein